MHGYNTKNNVGLAQIAEKLFHGMKKHAGIAERQFLTQ